MHAIHACAESGSHLDAGVHQPNDHRRATEKARIAERFGKFTVMVLKASFPIPLQDQARLFPAIAEQWGQAIEVTAAESLQCIIKEGSLEIAKCRDHVATAAAPPRSVL